MKAQFIAGTQSTPEAAQKASDEAHDGWRAIIDAKLMERVDEFLACPDTHTMDRMFGSARALLKSVEARRRSTIQGITAGDEVPSA